MSLMQYLLEVTVYLRYRSTIGYLEPVKAIARGVKSQDLMMLHIYVPPLVGGQDEEFCLNGVLKENLSPSNDEDTPVSYGICQRSWMGRLVAEDML